MECYVDCRTKVTIRMCRQRTNKWPHSSRVVGTTFASDIPLNWAWLAQLSRTYWKRMVVTQRLCELESTEFSVSMKWLEFEFACTFCMPTIRLVLNPHWLLVITFTTSDCSLWIELRRSSWNSVGVRQDSPGGSTTVRGTDCFRAIFVIENNEGYKSLMSLQLRQSSPCIWFFFFSIYAISTAANEIYAYFSLAFRLK